MKRSAHIRLSVSVAALLLSGCASKFYQHPTTTDGAKNNSTVQFSASAPQKRIVYVNGERHLAPLGGTGEGATTASVAPAVEKPLEVSNPLPYSGASAPDPDAALSEVERSEKYRAQLRATVGDDQANKILNGTAETTAAHPVIVAASEPIKPLPSPTNSLPESYPTPKLPLDGARGGSLREVLAEVAEQPAPAAPAVVAEVAQPAADSQARFRFGSSVEPRGSSATNQPAGGVLPPARVENRVEPVQPDALGALSGQEGSIGVGTIAALSVSTVLLILLGAVIGYRIHLSKIERIRRGR